MKFSVVIPAHNEAKFLPGCLEAIKKAKSLHGTVAEIIVVLNRCTDQTEQIAIAHGATIVQEDRKNIATIRNAGARHASGDVLVTVDSDSLVSENLFSEIQLALEPGTYVGGGVRVLPERFSLGISMTWLILRVLLFITGLAGGVYWCRLEDFWAVGGFNESLPFGEDLDFAKRLRAHGRKNRRRFTTLRNAHIVTSCRKFDKFGDWCFFRLALLHGREVRQGLQGKSTAFQNRFFYDFNSTKAKDIAGAEKGTEI